MSTGQNNGTTISNILSNPPKQSKAPVDPKQNARSKYEKYRFSNVCRKFINPLKSGITVNTISTGFKYLDYQLGAGISEGSITAIAGPPSVGKSTLALQIAQNMASTGRTVLYFSYEMGDGYVAAKGISRCRFKTNKLQEEGSFNAKSLLNSNNWKTKEYKSTEFQTALGETIGDINTNLNNFYVFDCSSQATSIDDIEKTLDDFNEGTDEMPIIFIDYLNMVPSPSVNSGKEVFSADKQRIDYTLQRMRSFASNNKATVIFITSLRKDDFKSGADLSSMMGSTNISYVADIVLAMQYAALSTDDFNEKAEQMLNPRRIQANIIKSRYYMAGGAIKFDYYSQYDYFDDSATENGYKSDPDKLDPEQVEAMAKLAEKAEKSRTAKARRAAAKAAKTNAEGTETAGDTDGIGTEEGSEEPAKRSGRVRKF